MPTVIPRDLSFRFRSAYAQDTFTRANTAGNTNIGAASGWGTDADGDTWSGLNTYTNSISSNKGSCTNATTTGNAVLGSKTLADGEILVRISVSATADSVGVIFRSANVNNQYRFRYTGGNFRIELSNTGTVSTLSTVSFTPTVSAFYWIHGRFFGKFLGANIWADGSSESAGWMISTTDTTFTSGNFGLLIKGNATTSVMTVDHFAVTEFAPIQRDVPTRLRVAAQQQPDLSMRLRVAIQQFQYLSTRFRLAFLGQRDLSWRTRIGAPMLRNLVNRVNMASQPQKKDLSTRVPMAARRFRSISMRYLQSTPKNQDLFLRFIMSLQTSKDFSLRILVRKARIRSISMRFNIIIPILYDLTLRLFLVTGGLGDLPLRLFLNGQDLLDIITRVNLIALTSKNLLARLRLSLTKQNDLPTRLRLRPIAFQSLKLRLGVVFPKITNVRTLAIRCRLLPSPLIDPAQLQSLMNTYEGIGTLPIRFPRHPYRVNGSILDSQPTICTTPLTLAGNTIPAGSSFDLLFSNPSLNTQTLLANGATVTMTFGLGVGDSATGLVTLSSTMVGSTYQVIVTTATPIPITTRVIQTPFF